MVELGFLEMHLESADTATTGAQSVVVADLYTAHHAAILRLCRRYLRNEVDAEDAAQETFLAAHRSLLAGPTPAQPVAWLATIARNTCWQRTQRRMREQLGAMDVDDQTNDHADTFAAAVRREESTQLWQAVGELPSQQQNAFVLCEVAGHSYSDAASRLGVSESALDALLVRARRRLRQRLRPLAGSLQGLFAAKAGALPVAAKLAAATVSVAVIGGGTVVEGIALHRAAVHHHARATEARSRPAPPPVRAPATAADGQASPALSAQGALERSTGGSTGGEGANQRGDSGGVSAQSAGAQSAGQEHGASGGQQAQSSGGSGSDGGGTGTVGDQGTTVDQAGASGSQGGSQGNSGNSSG